MELWHLLSTSGFPSLLVCCPSRLGGGFASPQLRRELCLRDTTWRHAWRIVCRSSGFWCMMTRATWQLWRRTPESAQPGLRAWPMHLQSSSCIIDDFLCRATLATGAEGAASRPSRQIERFQADITESVNTPSHLWATLFTTHGPVVLRPSLL